MPRGETAGFGAGLTLTYRKGFAPLRLNFDYASIEPPEDLGDTHTKMYSFTVSL